MYQFIEWCGRPVKQGWLLLLAICLVVALIMNGIQLGTNTQTSQRLTKDESIACVIQARGLPAQRDIVGIFGDFHVLLTEPRTKQAQAEERQIPPKQLAAELATLKDLNMKLANFTSIEAKQPLTRSCVF